MSAPKEDAGEHGEGWDEENEGANLWQANPPVYNTNLKELKAEILNDQNLRRLSPVPLLFTLPPEITRRSDWITTSRQIPEQLRLPELVCLFRRRDESKLTRDAAPARTGRERDRRENRDSAGSGRGIINRRYLAASLLSRIIIMTNRLSDVVALLAVIAALFGGGATFDQHYFNQGAAGGGYFAESDGGYMSDWSVDWDQGALGQGKCIDIPQNMSLCKNIGYTQMRLPNLLDHDTIREVTQQASSWVPLLGIRCHPDTKLFLCSLFSPVCLDHPIWPCRTLCEAVKNGCEALMLKYGFPWPEMLRCDKFPLDNDLCIGLQHDNKPGDDSILHSGSGQQ
ncbi:hypothetical protein LSH36_304g08008 [Paralvinella palmiformis]|uniref:FZ domain-containing protein n=1 Tax=Paralvinella palmiformis TaxID=53620 RepID=A0AAD9JJA4_9ANNE|nr:hypothetical protein LSH36_304g08008 [Paralvinella palmiformis]